MKKCKTIIKDYLKYVWAYLMHGGIILLGGFLLVLVPYTILIITKCNTAALIWFTVSMPVAISIIGFYFYRK